MGYIYFHFHFILLLALQNGCDHLHSHQQRDVYLFICTWYCHVFNLWYLLLWEARSGECVPGPGAINRWNRDQSRERRAGRTFHCSQWGPAPSPLAAISPFSLVPTSFAPQCLIAVFIAFLITNEFGHLNFFPWLFVVLFLCFCPCLCMLLSIRLFIFFLLICRSYLCILATSSLSFIWITNIFPQLFCISKTKFNFTIVELPIFFFSLYI